MMATIEEKLAIAVQRVKQMSPEEYADMLASQQASWVRGMTARCEHGEIDYEQCDECRKDLQR